jgi:hypothetical protein
VKRFIGLLCAAAVLAFGLGGCVVYPAGGYYYHPYHPYYGYYGGGR